MTKRKYDENLHQKYIEYFNEATANGVKPVNYVTYRKRQSRARLVELKRQEKIFEENLSLLRSAVKLVNFLSAAEAPVGVGMPQFAVGRPIMKKSVQTQTPLQAQQDSDSDHEEEQKEEVASRYPLRQRAQQFNPKPKQLANKSKFFSDADKKQISTVSDTHKQKKQRTSL